MDCKGIETVRRDNCGLVRTLISTCLRKILIERSVESAIAYTKDTISSLLMNKIDISLLIITKSLSAKYEEGGNKQASRRQWTVVTCSEHFESQMGPSDWCRFRRISSPHLSLTLHSERF